MNVSEKVRELLEKKAEQDADKPVLVGHEQRRWHRRGVERYSRKTEPVVRRREGLKPSARDLFAHLRPLLLASRPVLERDEDGFPTRFGAPTFRNVLDENGRHI